MERVIPFFANLLQMLKHKETIYLIAIETQYDLVPYLGNDITFLSYSHLKKTL